MYRPKSNIFEMPLQEKYIFDLDPKTVKVTWFFSQYPLHYVNYAPPKFEVATSNG